MQLLDTLSILDKLAAHVVYVLQRWWMINIFMSLIDLNFNCGKLIAV